MTRIVTDDVDEAERFLDDALARGHEGVMVKALDATYEAGRRRGATWLKVKPTHTLDLVVLAVEWGHGRRQGRLSNLHLGARDPRRDKFVMLGKTFKGMTDEMLAWQTTRLQQLRRAARASSSTCARSWSSRSRSTGCRRARAIPEGWPLRFARVKRYRPDKGVGRPTPSTRSERSTMHR